MNEISGKEILDRLLSYPLKEVKIQSFTFNGLKEEINIIYLKFDKWINLFFDDGILFIKEGYDNKQPKIESEGNIIEYSFVDLKENGLDFDLILNKKMTAFSISENFELILLFENNIELLIAQTKSYHTLDRLITIELRKGKHSV